MKIPFRLFVLLFPLGTVFSAHVPAQKSAMAFVVHPSARPETIQSPHRLDPSLAAWLSGTWSGEGAFSNGAAIKAKLLVHLSLDSAWLVLEHHDVPPHKYAATSFWGVDATTGQQLSYVFDNFQGHRFFTGNGWGGDSVVWVCQSRTDKAGVFYEHFIYRRLSDNQLKMTYETSINGISWRMGDYLIFTKISD